jgi:hypothetical protein
MTIDNFDIIRAHLSFEPAMKFDADTKKLKKLNDTYDRYIIQVLKRAKDSKGKEYGVNTSNRLIKTYEVSSLEYFDKKKDHIIDLCKTNCARAYILPQVRSTYDCLKEMIKIGVDNLENPTIKFQHILRSCLCSMHKSRDKKWILDLDNDSMVEHRHAINFGGTSIWSKQWTVESVMCLVKEMLIKCNKDPNSAYIVNTKSGHHIITPPFDLQSAYEKCNMMFEGEHDFIIGKEKDDKNIVTGEKLIHKKMNGWLHKDGMTLLYFSDEG